MAEGVPTNNQRGRRSGPCRLWGGLDKARHIVPTALLVRVQCFRKSLHKAVQGPSTRPIVVSMINGSYCRRRRRLTIFEPDEMKFGVSLTLLDTCNSYIEFMTCCQQRVFFTSPLKPLKEIQRNLIGSKISTSSTKFVFFGPIRKTRWTPQPLIGWNIFDFSSETAEQNSN